MAYLRSLKGRRTTRTKRKCCCSCSGGSKLGDWLRKLKEKWRNRRRKNISDDDDEPFMEPDDLPPTPSRRPWAPPPRPHERTSRWD